MPPTTTTTTLYNNPGTAPPFVSSESSSSRSAGSSSKGSSSHDQLLSSQPSEEATSPDFSTSSLISCSEHYNGESLLDNLSPQSPSSPDTPEWSLIANGESFHKDVSSSQSKKSSKAGQGESGHDSLITSKDNRVIITINQREGEEKQLNGHSSPGTSSGTITPDQAYSELGEGGEGGGVTSSPQVAPPQPSPARRRVTWRACTATTPPSRSWTSPQLTALPNGCTTSRASTNPTSRGT